MAAQTISLALSNASDALFRTWAQAIHNQLIAGGWVLTADTGQVNLTTMTVPVSNNTAAGYKMYRSNDATGGLNEFYVKIEFGRGSASTTASMWITTGWAADGAGNLVNTVTSGVLSNVGTRHQLGISGVAATDFSNLAAGLGWCAMTMGDLDAAGSNWYFSIERAHDNAGALKDTLLMVTASAQVAFYVETNVRSKGAYPRVNSSKNSIEPLSSQDFYDGKFAVAYLFGQAVGFTNPCMNVLGIVAGRGGAVYGTVVVPMYGANHTYIINPLSNGAIYFGSNASMPLLTRFE